MCAITAQFVGGGEEFLGKLKKTRDPISGKFFKAAFHFQLEVKK